MAINTTSQPQWIKDLTDWGSQGITSPFSWTRKGINVRNFIFNLLSVIAVCVSVTACASVKVTDPGNPQFDATQFRFEDYSSKSEISPVIHHMFPVGTDRSYVEKILVDIGQASSFSLPEKIFGKNQVRYTYRYRKMMPCSFILKADYDSNQRLKDEIWINFGCSAL